MTRATGDRCVTHLPRSSGARTWVSLAAGLALILTACNGDDDTAPTEPVESPVPTSAAATTAAPTTSSTTTTMPSTVAPTSDDASTVPDPTSPTPAPTTVITTPAPTTSQPSDEEDALAVLDGSYTSWRECLRDLPVCDTSTFATYLTEPQLSGDQGRITEWQAQSYEAVNVDSLTYEVIETHLDFAIPYVLVCETDHTAIVSRPAGEPEQVIVQYDGAKVREAQMSRTADGWRIEGFATREGEVCP